MHWVYQGKQINNAPDFAVGFVYIITNTISGKKYIGKKSLLKTNTKKSGNRKKKIIKESDWREYWGSNKELLSDIQYYGELNFVREILQWCESKGDANYYELKYQMIFSVLEHPDRFYNSYIGSRIHRNHLSCNKKPRE